MKINSTKVANLFKHFVLMAFLVLITTACGKSDLEQATPAEVMTSQIIVGSLDWKEITTLSLSNPIRQNGKAVADIDIPVLGSRCTGFMISADILMTNQHCIPTSRHASRVTAAFKHEKGVSESNWKKHDCSTFIGNNKKLDFALLKCAGSPGTKYGMVDLSSDSVNPGASIYIVQQNCDYYSQRGCDWSKKYSLGKITKKNDELVHNADTLGGSSGSPVFSSVTNEVIGLHHAGMGNNGLGRGIENYAVPMEKIVPYILTHFPQVDLGSSDSDDDDDQDQDEPSAFEPNESFSSAKKFSKSSFSGEKLEVSSSSDKDYFKFVAPSSGKLKVSMSFTHSKGDLDLKVYDGSKKQIAKSESTSSTEKAEIKVTKGRTYYIYVYGYRGATGKYSFSMSFQGTAPVAFDKEPNNTLAGASKVSFGQSGNGKISSSSDLDVFKLIVSRSKTVKVTLSLSSGAGDLDLFLIDGDVKTLAQSASTKKVENVSKFLSPGTYYVVVQGYRGAKGSYQLKVQ